MTSNRKQPTLLAVHAHPDDESFVMGGTLARCAAEGIRTILVVSTGGEVGEISDPALATPETLGAVRANEMDEAARILGIRRLVRLEYRDSGMAGTPDNGHPDSFHQADLDGAVERVVRLTREERPEVIVTYDEYGGYGHPDHIKAHQVTMSAFRAAGDPTRYPDAGEPWEPDALYYTILPRSQIERLREAFRQVGPEVDVNDDIDQSAFRFAIPDEQVTVSLDVSDFLEKKRAALLAHRTQMGPNSGFGPMPEETIRQLMEREYFIQVAGKRAQERRDDRGTVLDALF